MFEDDAQIRHYLISHDLLSEQQISGAIDYALDRNVSFEDSLVILGLLTFEQLGACLAELHHMPYRPLLQKPPSTFCKSILPPDLAEKWRAFPLEFDAENDLITIAISAPDQIKSFIRLEQKRFEHHRLAFSIAPRLEVERAINAFYKKSTPNEASVPEVPRDFSIITMDELSGDIVTLAEYDVHDGKKILLLEPDIEKGRALKTLLRREGYLSVTWVSSE
ncbi:MAG: hypothetical protein JXA71_14030, partial [Chitinispirillaceae bacterium]|nr:hypothetical protein [Chitinispirillaceae bacterium]